MEEDIETWQDVQQNLEYDASNVANLGYESINFVENLETLYPMILFFMLTWFLITLTFVLSNFCCCCEEYPRACYLWLMAKQTWNIVILFFIEGYLELVISVCVNSRYHGVELQDRHSLVGYTTAVIFALMLIVAPLAVYCFFRAHTEDSL